MKSPSHSGLVWCACVLAACGGKKDGDAKDEQAKPPITIAFGDCTTGKVPFVSGPRPLAPALDETTATADRPKPPPVDPSANPNVEGGAFASLTGTGDISSGFDDTNIYGGLLGSQGDPQGLGGGTGWGTIGTGRYGTIGHGSGTRAGYGIGRGGGLRGRPSAVPTVSIGAPNAHGDLDKAIIRRYIKRNIQKITYCYEKQLLVDSKLAGTVMVQFFITPNGNVASSNGAGVSPEVASCVAGVIAGIEFPKPRGGGGVQVNYPFTFRRAGDDAPVASAGSGAAGSGADDAGSAAVAAKPPQPTPPKPRVADYQPGATSPLHQIEGQLQRCLAAHATPYGVMVVDLAYDATTHAVTDASELGVDDKALAACIATAAKTIKRAVGSGAPGPATQRCGLAFGEMPSSAAPTIQITATDVTLNANVVDHPKDIAADTTQTWKVPALFEALDTWIKQTAPTETTIPIRGPGLLEPIDATPMKVVGRVLATTYAAGADFVLASQAGGAWRPLRELHLPVVPVPVGSGGSWSGLVTSKRQPGSAGHDRVMLSILVTKDAIWVGLSAIDEFQQITGRDWSKLETALVEHKGSALFGDRSDLEIAGEDEVMYADLVKLIELANRVGFRDWRVMQPEGLAARPHL